MNKIKKLRPERRLDQTYVATNQIYAVYRSRAKNANRTFALTFEDFKKLINMPCFYCDIQASNIKRYNGFQLVYNGIDRLDNSIGYELFNCVPCCKKCNYLKKDIKYEDLLLWIEYVYKTHILVRKYLNG